MSPGLRNGRDAVLAVKSVDDPRRFGVVEMDGEKVIDVVEKPDYIKPMDAMIGIYFFNRAGILSEALDQMVTQNRMTKGEYYLTDALKVMLEMGSNIGTFHMEGWFDCGKPDTLLATNRYLLGKAKPFVQHYEGSQIREPVFIDETAIIKNSIIGPNVSVSRGVEIVNSNIEDSIVNQHSFIENCTLKSSLVGEDAVVKDIKGRVNIGCHSEVFSINEE
jgi:glucose-1-phosphate thymidylyltransferase